MRVAWTLPLGLAAVWVGGCGGAPRPEFDPAVSYKMDAYSVGVYLEDAARNGIVAQRTIYPYDFEPDGSRLNELGRYRVSVLASALRGGTGPMEMNVRRVDESDPLYKARVASVQEAMRTAGVDVSRLTIGDGLPGGDGASADRAMRALQRSDQPLRSSTDGGLEGGLQLIDVNGGGGGGVPANGVAR